MKKLLALLLALCMVATLFVGCGKEEETTGAPETTTAAPEETTTEKPEETTTEGEETTTEDVVVDEPYTGADTLVFATATFGQKFTPFFYTTAYDGDVVSLTQGGLLASDREGNMILNGMDGIVIPYNGTDYYYETMGNCEIVENADGTIDYNLTMRDDIVFSDGHPANIDDVIFGIYVTADPTYDGSTTLYSLPIEGVSEYYESLAAKKALIQAAGPDAVAEGVTAEETEAYWTAYWTAGEAFAQEIVDYVRMAMGDDTMSVSASAEMWAFGGLAEDATAADFFKVIAEAYGYVSADITSVESAGMDLDAEIATLLGDAAASYDELVQLADVPNISGIIKTGEYSMTVKCTEYSAMSIYNMGFTIAPLHYYGDESLYDYDNNMFGFPKGDLSIVREKSTQPLGCGAYTFEGYSNGVVTLKANESYYAGCPKITYIKMTEANEADYIPGIETGTFDIAVPSMSVDVLNTLASGNSNGEIQGDLFHTILVDYRGYGYLGINGNLVSVGGDGSSDASKNLRKGLMTVLAIYRDVVINSYYGEMASVIQYPISNTSWAAPRPNDDGYENAYSVDVEGNPIYTADMNEEDKYAAALEAAIGFFKAAGYTFDEATGMFTAAPEGASMEYEILVPGQGTQSHPAYGIAVYASNALETIGIKLIVNDCGTAVWNDNLEGNTAELWCAAWNSTADPDMYQVYHSTNANGQGTNSNHYQIVDADLDAMIMEARASTDNAFRKATYKECLDIIMDWACELPLYQRQDGTVASSVRVNVDTLPKDMTPYWGWYAEIEDLEMN